MLEQTGGLPAVPLDDAYIHFQFARSFAELRPLTYVAGGEPVPGATSLLWPALLAPLWAIGLRGDTIIWGAWLFGWLSLGLLAHETRELARGIVGRDTSIAAAAMVLVFGGHLWFAGSGMEVVPLAWWLMRTARRAAEWGEAKSDDEGRRRELVLLGVLAPLVRPEGALATLIAALALGLFSRAHKRLWALAPLIGLALPSIVNLALTGQATSTTAIVKWLPLSPYHPGARLWAAVGYHLDLLVGTLLDGRIWSAVFLPRGSKWFALLALPALIAVAMTKRVGWRGTVTLLVALGIVIPTTYDSFLWNRLRYLWPFAAAWFVALAALAEGVGLLLARYSERLASLSIAIAGGFAGALAAQSSHAIEDLAVSADAIRRQQASLGRWAAENLPPDARIGVNDTGAIAYFSGRAIFDVVGLTTPGEARYWAAGAGSRFEHYEKLDRSRLPTHFIVYPQWLALPPLLGERLTERVVEATILGGTHMVTHVADYSTLGSGALPLAPPKRALADELDVADLESEADHAYALYFATQADDALVEHFAGETRVADGARHRRTHERFELEIAPGGVLVARLGAEKPAVLTVRAGGTELGKLRLSASPWQELTLELASGAPSGRATIELVAESGSFSALHYWSYR